MIIGDVSVEKVLSGKQQWAETPESQSLYRRGSDINAREQTDVA